MTKLRAKYGLSGWVSQAKSALARVAGGGQLRAAEARGASGRPVAGSAQTARGTVGEVDLAQPGNRGQRAVRIGLPPLVEQRGAVAARPSGERPNCTSAKMLANAPVVGLGPAVERVLVALGTFDPHAQKRRGRALGQRLDGDILAADEPPPEEIEPRL